MRWYIKITQKEDEKKQRIEITFDPLNEKIRIYGQTKVDNRSGDYGDGWVIFSQDQHAMEISLPELQEIMEKIIVKMNNRLEEYENLAKGFSVLKEIGFEEPTDDSQID